MSLSRYLKPPPLRSARITRHPRYYGWLRLPHIPARVLAFHTCSRVPAPCGPIRGSPRLPPTRNVRLDTASDPGEYPRHLPSRSSGCCLPEGQARRHSPSEFFGALHLQGRHHPLPLHLACFRAYASTRLLPDAQQGSILGSWLAITQVGFTPTKVRGIAKPLLSPISLIPLSVSESAPMADRCYRCSAC